MRCATPSRRTCWAPAATCAPSRSCWAMPASRPPSATPTSTLHASARSIGLRTRGRRSADFPSGWEAKNVGPLGFQAILPIFPPPPDIIDINDITSRRQMTGQEGLHIGHEGLPGRLVGAVVRAAAAARLAAIADAVEVAHWQAERVEAVMGVGIDVRLYQFAAGADPVEQRLALLDRCPVVERAHGDQGRQARPQLGPDRLPQGAVRIDQDGRPP